MSDATVEGPVNLEKDPDRGLRLSQDEINAIYEARIKPTLVGEPRDAPVVLWIGGPTGGGKTSLTTVVARDLGLGDAVQIDGDDLLPQHPQYARLQRENDVTAAARISKQLGGAWWDMAFKDALESRVDIVIGAPLGGPDWAAARMQDCMDAGYRVEVGFMGTDDARARLGVVDRYAEAHHPEAGQYGRWVEERWQQFTYDGVLDTADRIEAERLADALHVLRRGEGIISTRTWTPEAGWSGDATTRELLEGERARTWTKDEAAHFRTRSDVLETDRARLPAEIQPAFEEAVRRGEPRLREAEAYAPDTSQPALEAAVPAWRIAADEAFAALDAATAVVDELERHDAAPPDLDIDDGFEVAPPVVDREHLTGEPEL
ncbi:zeta toxin family protein [Yinghuangia aomiensis]